MADLAGPRWPLDRLFDPAGTNPQDQPGSARLIARLGPDGRYRRSPPRALNLDAIPQPRRDALREQFLELDTTYPAPRCVALDGAAVHGEGFVVSREGMALRGPPAPAGAAHPVSAPLSLLLKMPGWRDPQVWLTEGAAALAFAARLAWPEPWQIVIGQHEQPGQHAAMLRICRMLAPHVPVLAMPDDAVWQFATLLQIGPLRAAPAAHAPEGLSNLRAALLRHRTAQPPAPGRIFLAQGALADHTLENEAELAALAAKRGYRIVDAAGIAPADWSELFRGASHIVAARSALLAHVLFCVPAAELLVLGPADCCNPVLWDLAQHSGTVYAEIAGAVTEAGGFTVPPEPFAAILPP